MGIRLKKHLFPFICEIIIITIITTSTNPLKTLGKKRDGRWNETTAKGEKKEERRRLGNRKQRKEKEGEKNEERRKGADLPPRGDTAATSSINNIASWPRSFDIWKIRRGHPYPQPPLPAPPSSPLHARCRKPAGIQNGWLGLHRAWATVVPSTRAPPSSWNVSISPRWYLASFARPENSPLLVKNFVILLSIHLFIYLFISSFLSRKKEEGNSNFPFLNFPNLCAVNLLNWKFSLLKNLHLCIGSNPIELHHERILIGEFRSHDFT